MKTIRILEREHAWIGWLIGALEEILRRTAATDRLPDEAGELLELFRSFADGRHQDKEEECLYPELLTLARAKDRETLLRLVRDHATERRHLASMRLHLDGARCAEPLCVREFLLEATAYAALQRAHMRRESERLLPMIARLLTPDADERVAAACEELEGGPGDPQHVEARILALRERVNERLPPVA